MIFLRTSEKSKSLFTEVGLQALQDATIQTGLAKPNPFSLQTAFGDATDWSSLHLPRAQIQISRKGNQSGTPPTEFSSNLKFRVVNCFEESSAFRNSSVGSFSGNFGALCWRH